LLSGIRVHTKQWSRDDAQRCFEGSGVRRSTGGKTRG
jgi:hypothetical protein